MNKFGTAQNKKNGRNGVKYVSPLADNALEYSTTFKSKQSCHPISGKKMLNIFRTGVQKGRLSTAILPLLASLTGRRLGLLISLRGSDIAAKFSMDDGGTAHSEDIYVAKPNRVQFVKDRWVTAPLKTADSEDYFALCRFLFDIGFIQWAQSLGDKMIFEHFYSSSNPSSLASKQLNKLLKECGCVDREVFHSNRGQSLDHLRDSNVTDHTIRQQAGHAPSDDHGKYGHKVLTEPRCRTLWALDLPPHLESNRDIFKGLDFDALRNADLEASTNG